MRSVELRNNRPFIPLKQERVSPAAARISSILKAPVTLEVLTSIKGGFLVEIAMLEAQVSKTCYNRHMRAYFSDINESPGLLVLTLRKKGNLIGYVVGGTSAEPSSFMGHLLGIDRDHQFRGIAKPLLLHYFELIKAKGYESVCLTCLPRSNNGTDLPAFYSSLGFGATAVKDFFERRL
jgi:ribosomal protein S18 acetylase RimI-like enzyme